jgi:hypothetical protein
VLKKHCLPRALNRDADQAIFSSLLGQVESLDIRIVSDDSDCDPDDNDFRIAGPFCGTPVE